MKEPWKKTCNGKVIITLNDEKTEPTEVELPVDLNWGTNRPGDAVGQWRLSVSKTIVLLSFIFLLGLSTYSLWKVQELEDVIEEERSVMSAYRRDLEQQQQQKPLEVMILDNGDRLVRPAALVGSNLLSRDEKENLRGSESRYPGKLQNAKQEPQESQVQSQKKLEIRVPKKPKKEMLELNEEPSADVVDSEDEDEDSDDNGANNGKSNDSGEQEEWIKPLVETLDIFGSHPMEDNFLHSILNKILSQPDSRQVEVLEYNKPSRANEVNNNNNNNREHIRRIPIKVEQASSPSMNPFESILMKTLMPPQPQVKVFHFSNNPERSDNSLSASSSSSEEDSMGPREFLKQMLPPLESGILKSLMGPMSNMKIVHLNGDQRLGEQSMGQEDDMPKITIQSIKLKLLPLPAPEEFIKKDPSIQNFEQQRHLHQQLHQQQQQQHQQQPSSSEEQQQMMEPKMPMMPMPMGAAHGPFHPLPMPVQDIIMKTLMPMKNFEIIPLGESVEPMIANSGEPEHQIHHQIHQSQPQPPQQQHQPQPQQQQPQPQAPPMPERFTPFLPLPIHDLMKTFLPPPPNFDIPLEHKMMVSSAESQEQDQEPQPLPHHQQPQQPQQPQQQSSNENVQVRRIPIRFSPFPIPEELLKPVFQNHFEAAHHQPQQDEVQQPINKAMLMMEPRMPWEPVPPSAMEQQPQQQQQQPQPQQQQPQQPVMEPRMDHN